MAVRRDEIIEASAFTALVQQTIANNRAGGCRKIKKSSYQQPEQS